MSCSTALGLCFDSLLLINFVNIFIAFLLLTISASEYLNSWVGFSNSILWKIYSSIHSRKLSFKLSFCKLINFLKSDSMHFFKSRVRALILVQCLEFCLFVDEDLLRGAILSLDSSIWNSSSMMSFVDLLTAFLWSEFNDFQFFEFPTAPINTSELATLINEAKCLFFVLVLLILSLCKIGAITSIWMLCFCNMLDLDSIYIKFSKIKCLPLQYCQNRIFHQNDYH